MATDPSSPMTGITSSLPILEYMQDPIKMLSRPFVCVCVFCVFAQILALFLIYGPVFVCQQERIWHAQHIRLQSTRPLLWDYFSEINKKTKQAAAFIQGFSTHFFLLGALQESEDATSVFIAPPCHCALQ